MTAPGFAITSSEFSDSFLMYSCLRFSMILLFSMSFSLADEVFLEERYVWMSWLFQKADAVLKFPYFRGIQRKFQTLRDVCR